MTKEHSTIREGLVQSVYSYDGLLGSSTSWSLETPYGGLMWPALPMHYFPATKAKMP